MRVLHLTRDYPPKSCGGVSTAVGGLVEALQRRGLTCAVASFDGWRPSKGAQDRPSDPVQQDLDGLAVLRLRPPAGPEALRPFATGFEPDLIHVHESLLWDQADGAGLSKGIGRLLTVHVYQHELNRLRGVDQTLSSRAEERALERADLISAPSNWVAETLERDRPTLAGRVRLAGWGVDTSVPRPTRPLPGNRALYVGRFGDVKGTAELGEIAKRLLERSPHARMIIAGGLPHNRKAEARWRKRLTADLPEAARPRVELPGWLSGAALNARFRNASATIVPSRFETFGLTALEAMAWGLPVVATRAGALPELIEHGQTGLLCEPGDSDGLADGLADLLGDPVMATALGDAGRRRVQDDLTWEKRIADWLAIYGAL